MSIGGLIAVLGGLLLLVLGKVCLDLASKQVQGWLFDLCFLVLRWARRRLPTALREAWHDEELVPELKYILFDKYANEPVVGLYRGLRFAIGHVRGAKRLARESGVERDEGISEELPEWMHRAIRDHDRRYECDGHIFVDGRRGGLACKTCGRELLGAAR